MEIIFEVEDKIGKRVYLSKERLKHILKHPLMHDQMENIQKTLQDPTTIRHFEDDESVIYFYKEFKQRLPSERYLLLSVKYLNGNGFIVTSFFTNKVKGLKLKIK